MFELGWGEMLLIGVVALIVVGPKDLPVLFRSLGQFVGKARGLAREFSRAMEAAADESGVKEIDKTIRAATRPVQFATDRLREQSGLSRTPPKVTLPPAGAPLSATPPLNPGEPIAAAAASPAPASAVGSPAAAAPSSATEALRQRRAGEKADLQAGAEERRTAPAAEPAPTDGTS